MDVKGHKRRMGDDQNIPEMNGTIKSLVELISSPMKTPQQQEQAIRESIKVQLHTYIMQKELLESMNELLKERRNIKNALFEKALVPFLYVIGTSVLWLIVTHFTQIP